jgi:hypothetical protein
VNSQRDLEAIHLFEQRLMLISKSRLAYRLSRETLAVDIWKRPSGKFEAVFPSADDDDVAAFVLHLRLLIQDNDRISVRRISRMLPQLALTKDCRSKFEKIRTRLNTWLNSQPIGTIRNFPKTNRELLNTFLYGQYAHHSKPHYSRLKQMRKVAPDGSFDAQFLYVLQRLLRLVSEFHAEAMSIEGQLKSREH